MYSSFLQKLTESNNIDTGKAHSPIPRLLFIRVTEACNASCFMCAFAGNQTPHLFTAEKARLLVNDLVGSSIRHVRLTGGEPLLLEDIGQIVSTFKDAGFVVSIITNGMFLEERWSDLKVSGLDQILVSIDSPRTEMHDKLRKTEGLFKNALSGIVRIRAESPSTLIRVNTVVGKHNLKSLSKMFVLLHELGVNQWSLIPLKPFQSQFPEDFENIWFSVRAQLLSHISQLGQPRLMGNSVDLFGSNPENHRRIMAMGCPQTPQPKCELVEWIRYLDLASQRVFPCNCVPHRGVQATPFGESWGSNSWSQSALESSRVWLRHNGPAQCTGCEPINAALGEGSIDLDEDIFGF